MCPNCGTDEWCPDWAWAGMGPSVEAIEGKVASSCHKCGCRIYSVSGIPGVTESADHREDHWYKVTPHVAWDLDRDPDFLF